MKSISQWGDFDVDADDFNYGINNCSISGTTDCGTVTKTFTVTRDITPIVNASDLTFTEGVSIIVNPIVLGGFGGLTTYIQLYDANGNPVGPTQSTNYSSYSPFTYSGLTAANSPYRAEIWAKSGVGCTSRVRVITINMLRGRITGCGIRGDFEINGVYKSTCGVSFLHSPIVNRNVIFDKVEWNFGDGTATKAYPAGQAPIHKFNKSGTYTVSSKFFAYNAADRTSCTSIASHKVYVDCTNGIARIVDNANKTVSNTNTFVQEELQGVTIYPNPSQGNVNIALDQDASNVVVKVFNTLGENVKSFVFEGSNEKLDLSNLAKGMYIIQVTANEQTKSERLMIH